MVELALPSYCFHMALKREFLSVAGLNCRHSEKELKHQPISAKAPSCQFISAISRVGYTL